MANITLKDGAVREVAEGTTVLDFVKSFSNSLAKKALACKIDGETKDLMTVIDGDHQVEILTFEDEDGRWALRHSASHILAQAVKRLYGDKNVKLAIGPAIDNGFYYDFDMDHQLSTEDLAKIEKEMKKIVKENLAIVRKEVTRQEALDFFNAEGESYKVELINDLPEDAMITMYSQGEFTDLCAGPHVVSTGKVKAIKLQSVAGAYWRGSEKNKMLQRVYGTAFEKQADLVTAETVQKLNQVFITPIDREDIFALSYGLDDGVDNIHGSLERVIMYEAGQPKTDGPAKLSKLLIQATEELVKATALLKDIRKNHNEILECTNRILTYESQGDTLYRSEMSSLFKTEKDPITLVKWKDILQCLEDTLDQTKHISDTLKGVVMKYA